MKQYDHTKIEKKWQKVWESKKPNKVKEDNKKKKFYALIEFPYPSGDGLHVGHIRSNTAMDIISRKRRREGYNVLYPIGWDAFGLPTENYAIKTGIQPSVVTKKNTDTFRRQLKSLGFSFDWSREINTTDPKYYKWTQWIFLQFFKKGLAYKKKMTINWCPKDLIGLANEEVINGCCERCGTPVERKEKEQWMLAITKYADRLDKDLDDTEYLDKIKTYQRNWIGKSEGAEIDFKVKDSEIKIKVYTTRPDTLYGVTYVVIAPEYANIASLISKSSNKAEIEKYISTVKNKTEIERTDAKSDKTGFEIKGVKVINPINNIEVPLWIADYVLADYGTGAVMAVPAHDERDFEFAKKYNLEIKEVLLPNIIDLRNPPKPGKDYVERRNVHPIVLDRKTGKYLALKWKKYDWTTFPMGGIEEGEDIVEAARREVREETGFTNLKLIKVLDGTVRAEYFAAHKDQNRISFTNAVLFELVDHTKVDIDQKEKDAHEIIWLDRNQLNYNVMTHAEIEMWNDKMSKTNSPYTGEGILINSDKFNNKNSDSIRKEITKFANGKWVTKFKLRDWVFSRQRYWGEPIPVIHCDKCGMVPVPEKDLPLQLPKVKNYSPTGTGESPLAGISKWVNTKCPQCKSKARRETDTMPQWAGSSWYYLRYMDPKNSKKFADNKNLKYWGQVDWYNGGMEHATLHLLYSRFWHKFLFDLGLVPTSEPYKKRTSHGMILAENGEKMSKSRGNVVNPDSLVRTVGADTLRIHEMFMGPFDQAIAWDTNTIAGSRRFIERVWKLQDKVGKVENEKINVQVNKTIKKVGEDIEAMRFNTAISSMMILLNEFEKEEIISKGNYEALLKLLAPFAPHVSEELWSILKNKKSIHISDWPKYNESKLVDQNAKIIIQINGKIRGTIESDINASESDIKSKVLELPDIKKWVNGLEIKKVIYIKGKLINLVI